MAVGGSLIERPPAPRRPERRRLGSSAALSALLHGALLAALVLAARQRAQVSQWLPPPSVQMVFEGGGKGKSSVPNKAPRVAHRPASPAPRPAPLAPAAPAPAPRPVPPTPPAARTAPPAPQPAETVPPPPKAPPVRPTPNAAPRSLPAPPAPAPPAPVRRTLAPVAPSPGIAPPVAAPRPAPPAPAQRLPAPPQQPAVPKPPPAPAPPRTARPALRFPAPTEFSLGGTKRQTARAAPQRRPGRGINLSFAPEGSGGDRLSINGLLDRDGVGPDWSNAFSAWLAQHSYYPRDAGAMGEHGNVVVDFVVGKDGSVSGLRLVSSSGHPLLDMATLSMFRDAHLPPLPPQDGARLPVRFTMRYIIRH